MPENEKTDPFAALIEGAMNEIMIQEATEQFERGIVLCMEAERVNLEAAISMVREHMEMENIAYPQPEQFQSTALRVVNLAADRLRARFETMRKLVSLDDNGSPEPRPYDAAKAKAARDQLAFEMQMGSTGPQTWN